MNDISLDYNKHGIEKCNREATSALFYVIGYLQVTIKNEFGDEKPEEIEYAKKVYERIERQLSEVMKKQ